MPDATSIVFVVDDDVSVRESLELLLQNRRLATPRRSRRRRNSCPRPAPRVPCCLVLDVTLPGLSGLELQKQLAERTDMPIIFITGLRRRADDRAGDEGGSRRVPDEAVSRTTCC
jgi:FixJ family two-component response regulator